MTRPKRLWLTTKSSTQHCDALEKGQLMSKQDRAFSVKTTLFSPCTLDIVLKERSLYKQQTGTTYTMSWFMVTTIRERQAVDSLCIADDEILQVASRKADSRHILTHRRWQNLAWASNWVSKFKHISAPTLLITTSNVWGMRSCCILREEVSKTLNSPSKDNISQASIYPQMVSDSYLVVLSLVYLFFVSEFHVLVRGIQ